MLSQPRIGLLQVHKIIIDMEQRPKEPNTWLTRLLTNTEKDREFVKVVNLPAGASLWDECTDEEYLAWKTEYEPEPEPLPDEPIEEVSAEEVTEEVTN
jgi:hypothetical protein